VLQRIARLAIGGPRRILAIAALLTVAAAIFGVPVHKYLSAGGFQDPTAQSSRANQILADTFKQGDMQLVFAVTSADGTDSPAARAAGKAIVDYIKGTPHVTDVRSPWTAPSKPAAAGLISKDGKIGLIVAGIGGGESDAQKNARTVADAVSTGVLPSHPGVDVRAGGSAMVYAQVNEQNQHDLLLMEAIAIPLSFLVLVWVFGGLLAAALPLLVAGFAIAGSMAVLRLLTHVTDVSVFALNLSTAMGLALAIDYTLLIVSRYRDELADGADRHAALIRTMMTAGRTVIFSAVTVALSIAAMALFPMYFLKSFAYAGIATVLLCAVASILVTPALIALLGPRLDALNVVNALRGGRGASARKPAEQQFWYRTAKAVMRRAVPIGVAGIALLLFLGLPFLSVKWGFPDDRVLPTSASAHQVGDLMRSQFATNADTAVTIVVRDADGVQTAEFERYARELSEAPDVSAVTIPTGTFVAGRPAGPPAAPTGITDGAAFLTVGSEASLFSADSERQLDALHAIEGPGGRTVEFTGVAQINRDSVAAITTRVPLVLGIIAAVTFVLLFLLTGSVVLPLKALVLNVLSLTAAFGALVWIFQDGHFGAFGTTPTGTLVANIPVLLFCIAFGLSMDYEVFLVSRIREFWLESDRGPGDNEEAVALGLAYTGRVITAAALVMSISFAALIAAKVSFMRMFGVGLTLAVLVDATLVRMVLVPAFMRVMGHWNWWAPKPLARLHERIGISEAPPDLESVDGASKAAR
jgi:putative drug exporter of the RND superfamily